MSFVSKKNIVSLVSGLALLAGSQMSMAEEAPASVLLRAAKTEHLNVYKSPTCGCCEDWIEHAEDNGFDTKAFHPRNLDQMKQEMGIRGQWKSCHTAVSESGYLFEGHVPARLVKQFLANPPEDALGLTAPGMPMGSPGMEMGDRFQPYQILQMKRDGSSEVYATIDKQSEQY